jgi:hypothetical protein
MNAGHSLMEQVDRYGTALKRVAPAANRFNSAKYRELQRIIAKVSR